MSIYNILVFTLIVIQEVTRAAVCPEPCRCQQVAAQSHEEITVICKRAALTKLDASFNSITALKNNTFARNCLLVKIHSLNFSHNTISSIEVLAFSSLPHLHKLDLSDNKLTTLHPWTFSYTRYLSWLNLSNNNMLALPGNGHFIKTPNLRILDLSFCNLVEISKDSFCCAPNLEYIRLDSNKFETLNVSVFTQIFADKVSTEECYASATALNKLRYLNISGNPLKCDCQFYKIRTLLEKFNIEYELQSSCANTKYNISDVCSDKQINQHNEIASVKSEATISVVTTNVGENSSGSSVKTSTQLPSREAAHLLNTLLQAMTNIITRDVKTQKVSEVSTNVAKDATEAIPLDDSNIITPSFRIKIIAISVLLCVFIFLTVVLLILLLRQCRKNERRNILSSPQHLNNDCESYDLNHYEYVGEVPSNWTPFPRPVMYSAL